MNAEQQRLMVKVANQTKGMTRGILGTMEDLMVAMVQQETMPMTKTTMEGLMGVMEKEMMDLMVAVRLTTT